MSQWQEKWWFCFQCDFLHRHFLRIFFNKLSLGQKFYNLTDFITVWLSRDRIFNKMFLQRKREKNALIEMSMPGSANKAKIKAVRMLVCFKDRAKCSAALSSRKDSPQRFEKIVTRAAQIIPVITGCSIHIVNRKKRFLWAAHNRIINTIKITELIISDLFPFPAARKKTGSSNKNKVSKFISVK